MRNLAIIGYVFQLLAAMMSRKAAYVTLLTETSYLAGTLVLHHGLRAVNSKYPLVVMVTPSLPSEARKVLHMRGILTREVESLQPREGSHALASHDARFADTWTKLRYFLTKISMTIAFYITKGI